VTVVAGGAAAARPQLIRAINEQVLLEHIRRSGPVSRTELAALTGLSKPTVSAALATIERAGLVHASGQRTGPPGGAEAVVTLVKTIGASGGSAPVSAACVA